MDIISHRGASAYSQENSLKSFAIAKSMGSTMFELDVHLTKDNKIVVHHDYNLKRLFNKNLEIINTPYKNLKKHIPTLAQVLKLLGKHCFVCVEIKNDDERYQNIEYFVLKEIYKSDFQNNVCISGFSYKTLQNVRALDSKINIGYSTKIFDLKEAKKLKASSVHISKNRVNKKIVETAHKNKIQVFAYTVNDEKIFDKMKKLHIDAVFSDKPELGQKKYFKV
ncbi:MAG: glycerophosphodiester phosphodiesterase [Elusimicrobiaceae bacterium]|jgi:glycerophosphoryl diester phosphodiesterase|nr:glycerophosphodiester phosphodiesterase [Elusimicrobiaceae bacterium]MBT3955588.1 glycerophosphodiester phosphodiesterase [Elusimicrobiaceae bacterium]MBT4008649.1 glycerophosphodiester phosphodiesterase [Elusimicrobiaceae bacterium]MBT4402743.1 glycerophosphodiester phosphodiesterase [Elusimicrobiaceae bacterium]MBT4439622.1 glycerophosphodiester phosphodiesterase [Elusimicrobiaceae bacterium]